MLMSDTKPQAAVKTPMEQIVAAARAVEFGAPLRADRVGQVCWFQKDEGESEIVGFGLVRNYRWTGGRLLAWSTNHEEYERGPGQFPAAVVEELETGKVHVVFAGFVSFATHPPKE